METARSEQGVSSPDSGVGAPIGPRLPRRWPDVLLLLVTLAALAGTITRFVPLPAPGPAIQALYPLTGAVAVFAAAVWVLRRRWGPAALAVPAAACALALTVGSFRSTTVPPSSDDLMVMSINLFYGRADTDALMVEVRARQPDVLVLVEASSAAMARLTRSGLDSLLPHRAGDADVEWEPAGGTVIRSRTPLTVLDRGTSSVFRQPVVRIAHRGAEVTVRGVHPLAPALRDASEWAADLADLGRWTRARPSGEHLVMAGDFNASSAHPAFRSATRGMVDAQAATGAGWVRTWPLGRRIPAFVELDHVAVRNLGVVDAGQFAIPRSDHAGVWARLRLPEAGVASPEPPRP